MRERQLQIPQEAQEALSALLQSEDFASFPPSAQYSIVRQLLLSPDLLPTPEPAKPARTISPSLGTPAADPMAEYQRAVDALASSISGYTPTGRDPVREATEGTATALWESFVPTMGDVGQAGGQLLSDYIRRRAVQNPEDIIRMLGGPQSAKLVLGALSLLLPVVMRALSGASAEAAAGGDASRRFLDEALTGLFLQAPVEGAAWALQKKKQPLRDTERLAEALQKHHPEAFSGRYKFSAVTDPETGDPIPGQWDMRPEVTKPLGPRQFMSAVAQKEVESTAARALGAGKEKLFSLAKQAAGGSMPTVNITQIGRTAGLGALEYLQSFAKQLAAHPDPDYRSVVIQDEWLLPVPAADWLLSRLESQFFRGRRGTEPVLTGANIGTMRQAGVLLNQEIANAMPTESLSEAYREVRTRYGSTMDFLRAVGKGESKYATASGLAAAGPLQERFLSRQFEPVARRLPRRPWYKDYRRALFRGEMPPARDRAFRGFVHWGKRGPSAWGHVPPRTAGIPDYQGRAKFGIPLLALKALTIEESPVFQPAPEELMSRQDVLPLFLALSRSAYGR